MSVGLDVRGPHGKLKCDIPHSDEGRSPVFVRIAPGDSLEDTSKAVSSSFHGLHRTGRYTIAFAYDYDGTADPVADKQGLRGVWRGKIRSKEETLTVNEDKDGWVKSADGVLALHVSAGAVKPEDPIHMIASLRNLSDKPVNVLRPCGDEYRARSSGIELHGPTGALGYTGPTPTYTLGSKAFFTLEPGDTISDPLQITVDNRKGSDAAGEYRLTFTYEATPGNRDVADKQFGKGLWTGKIQSKTLTVRKSEPAKDRELTEADALRAFRTAVEPIVKKLPEEASKYWLEQLRDDKKWSVKRQPFADGLKRVDGTLSAEERKTAILHGTLDDLKLSGDCWTIQRWRF